MSQSIDFNFDMPISDPLRGKQAFLQDSKTAAFSRSAQLLLLTTYVIGSEEQIKEIEQDADELGVPFVLSAGAWRMQTQSDLDALTRSALEHHVPWPEVSEGGDRSVELVLWEALEANRQPAAALALVNYCLGSDAEVQRVCAAACIHAYFGGDNLRTSGILLEGLESENKLIAEIAAAALGLSPNPPNEESPFPVRINEQETSLAVHGTWARLAEERWYAPGSPLHVIQKKEVNQNLYSDQNYFRWSGGYSQQERDEGAADFPVWKQTHNVGFIDTVYAHSHGGNVALSRIASGETIRLLVLLHTPALPRPSYEWEAIQAGVARVLVMRSRADLVILADGLRTGSWLNFDKKLLPHRRVLPHWNNKEAWFSHSLFVNHQVWKDFGIAGEVKYEHEIAEKILPMRVNITPNW